MRNECCHRCVDERPKTGTWIDYVQGMITCGTCGYKRCPKATDHRHECTNSNEPGQLGSVYGEPIAQPPTTMTKRKPCVVTITRTNYADQPYVVTIDKPGKAEPYKLKQRYADRKGAKRGALRNLKAQTSPVTGEWFYAEPSGKVVWIEFVFTTSKRKR